MDRVGAKRLLFRRIVQFLTVFLEEQRRRKELMLYQLNIAFESLFLMAVARSKLQNTLGTKITGKKLDKNNIVNFPNF